MIQKSAITLLAALACTAQGAAPLESSTPDQPNPPLPVDEAGGQPKSSFQVPPAIGFPFQRLFRNTARSYHIGTNDLKVDATLKPADTLKFEGSLDLPDFRGQIPLLQRGFAPETADMKIGPLYFKLRQLSAGVLWTDNVFRNNARRESDTRGFVSIGAQIIWQIAEGTRLAVSGNFVWLPFDDDAGLTGFRLAGPLSFGLASTPDLRVQGSWEPMIFGIPWIISDEFRTGAGRFTNGIYDSFELFEGFRLEDDDESPRIFGFKDRDYNFQTSNGNDEFIFLSNEISAATQAKVSGDLNFRFRASHEDLWYPNNEESGLPSARNTVSASLESYRESLRFKPYLNYRLSQQDDPNRLYQSVRLGVKGPVTDLIHFNGNVGYLVEDRTDNESLIWYSRLEHTINPRTRHSLEWSRNSYELSDEISQQVLYQFNHILGPGLSTDLYAGYYWVEELTDTVPDREDFRTGARLTWRVSPRTSVRLLGQYTDISNATGSFQAESWRGRLELSHRLYDRINMRLNYQHTNLESERGAASYDENLLYFTVSYYFE